MVADGIPASVNPLCNRYDDDSLQLIQGNDATEYQDDDELEKAAGVRENPQFVMDVTDIPQCSYVEADVHGKKRLKR